MLQASSVDTLHYQENGQASPNKVSSLITTSLLESFLTPQVRPFNPEEIRKSSERWGGGGSSPRKASAGARRGGGPDYFKRSSEKKSGKELSESDDTDRNTPEEKQVRTRNHLCCTNTPAHKRAQLFICRHYNYQT